MFVVLLSYIKPLETIDALLEAHVEYLEKNFADGYFLAAGRRVPRTGGVILAKAENLDELQNLLAKDPFAQEGAANYEIVEFYPTKTANGLNFLRD